MPKPPPATELEALSAVRTLISYIGDDPDREGLRDTPQRVLRAWEQSWGAGYRAPTAELVKLFTEPSHDEHGSMVLIRGITFHSTCEHHMAPFYGTADVAYIPEARFAWSNERQATERVGSKIVGLSKLARIVDHFARRLQVQERLTNEIADFIKMEISEDCAIVMRAQHMCMMSRGVQQAHAETITSALRGVFYHKPEARSEFLRLTQGAR
jgi:GTP cyclohydrolase I